jgi:hypothetical protein
LKVSLVDYKKIIKNREIFKEESGFIREFHFEYYNDFVVDMFHKETEDTYLFIVAGNLRHVSNFCSKENVTENQNFRKIFWEKEIQENEKEGKYLWGVAHLYITASEYVNFPKYFDISGYSDLLSKSYPISLTSVITFSVSMEKNISQQIETLRNHFNKQFVIDSILSKEHTTKHLKDMGIIEDEKNCFFIENSNKMPQILLEHIFRENEGKTIVFYNKNQNFFSYIPQTLEKIETKELIEEEQNTFSLSSFYKQKTVLYNKVFVLSPYYFKVNASSFPCIGYGEYFGLGNLKRTQFFSDLVEILHLLEQEKEKSCCLM